MFSAEEGGVEREREEGEEEGEGEREGKRERASERETWSRGPLRATERTQTSQNRAAADPAVASRRRAERSPPAPREMRTARAGSGPG